MSNVIGVKLTREEFAIASAIILAAQVANAAECADGPVKQLPQEAIARIRAHVKSETSEWMRDSLRMMIED